MRDAVQGRQGEGWRRLEGGNKVRGGMEQARNGMEGGNNMQGEIVGRV